MSARHAARRDDHLAAARPRTVGKLAAEAVMKRVLGTGAEPKAGTIYMHLGIADGMSIARGMGGTCRYSK